MPDIASSDAWYAPGTEGGSVGALMGERRTAWHYFLDLLLTARAPRHFEVRNEEPLTRALQHMDWLVLRRHGLPSADDPGGTLVDLWPLLPEVTIVEFKSAAHEYRAREFDRLIGYGHQYFCTHPEEVARRADLALVLLVAERNGPLEADLADLGVRETPLGVGYSALDGLAFRTILVALRALVGRVAEEPMALFVPGVAVEEETLVWWYSSYGARRRDGMDPRRLEDFEDVMKRFLEVMPLQERLAGMTIEQRLAGLAPEQRLAGLAPEQRLAGLAPEQIAATLATRPESEQVLALPDHLLALLPDDYVMTLPEAVQAKVRVRRGR